MKLSNDLREAIERETAAADLPAMLRSARALSESYRAGNPSRVGTKGQAIAYAATRLPATYAANRHAMDMLARRLDADGVRTLLDLGGGPGTSSWAAAEVFPFLNRITVLERNAEFTALGRRLAASSSHPALRGADWRQEGFGSTFPKHDLVTISYVLGELEDKQIASLLRHAWEASAIAMLVIEPGTPRGFSNILQARSFLVDHAHLAAPCPHELACPLGREGDWCHFAERVERSSLHRRAKQGTLGYEDEKFSCVAGVRHAVAFPRARIVRHPRIHSGHVQLDLCVEGRHDRITIGKSQKDLYRAARAASWGDAWE